MRNSSNPNDLNPEGLLISVPGAFQVGSVCRALAMP